MINRSRLETGPLTYQAEKQFLFLFHVIILGSKKNFPIVTVIINGPFTVVMFLRFRATAFYPCFIVALKKSFCLLSEGE